MRYLDLYLANNSPIPEAEEEISSAAMMESDGDLPGQDIESDGLGSDTDLDDLADAPKQSDVEHFASMLQEAQRIAVEIKRHETEQKRKMPKTYRGNSKKTLYRREKARKALASKGFLDIASFIALKEVPVQGAHESADSDVREASPYSMGPAPLDPASVPSGSSGLACFTGYQRAGGRRVVVEEEEEEENAPTCELDARANALEVEWHGSPSVSSGPSGFARFHGYRKAGDNRAFEEEEEEEDEAGIPACELDTHADALEVERCQGTSVSSGPLGIAHFHGYQRAGGNRAEEEEEGIPACELDAHANMLEVEQCHGPLVPSRPFGLAPGPTRFAGSWTAQCQTAVVAEEEESESPPEMSVGTGTCGVEWLSRASAPSRALGFDVLAGPSSTGDCELQLVEEEQVDAPESVPDTDVEMYGVDRRSGGSAPLEVLDSSASGGPAMDGVDLLGSESHLDGHNDDFDDVDGDDNERCHSDNGAWKVPDLATDTLKAILDALHSGQDPTHIVPNTPFDRALDLWKDHEKLGQARMSLAAKSKDPSMDIFFGLALLGCLVF